MKTNEVSGVVLDPDGRQPVAGAEVYAFFDGPTAGILPETMSDWQGRYELSNLQPGPYWIVAKKVEDGYPDPTDALYRREWWTWIPKIQIREHDRLEHADIRLAPKAGRLEVWIFDADTKLPLKGVCTSVTREDDPEHGSSGCSTWRSWRGVLLLPPVPCKVKIQSVWVDQKAEKVLETEQWTARLLINAGSTQQVTLYLHVHVRPTLAAGGSS